MDEGAENLAIPPVALDEVEESRHVELGAHWIILGEQASERRVEHETLDALRIRCRKQQGKRATLVRGPPLAVRDVPPSGRNPVAMSPKSERSPGRKVTT
jgi:hypothetical protein